MRGGGGVLVRTGCVMLRTLTWCCGSGLGQDTSLTWSKCAAKPVPDYNALLIVLLEPYDAVW